MDLDDDIEVIRSFAVLNRTFLSFFSDSIAEKGISYSEGIFLVNIGYRPGVTQERLARDLVIDKAAVARSVKSLRAKGHTRTKRSVEDKRENHLFLTETGIELFRFIKQLNRRWVGYVLSDVPPEATPIVFEAIRKMSARSRNFPG